MTSVRACYGIIPALWLAVGIGWASFFCIPPAFGSTFCPPDGPGAPGYCENVLSTEGKKKASKATPRLDGRGFLTDDLKDRPQNTGNIRDPKDQERIRD